MFSGNIIGKSSEKSEEMRKDGNRIFISKHSEGDKKHIKTLALYSKSIAFAPKGSEELAVAYGNRSALLKHLKFPEKSLIDIDRALKITQSDDLKTKLLARKLECSKLKDEIYKSKNDASLSDDKIGSDSQIRKGIPTTGKFKLPLFTPSQEIPCAAESVTIAYNKSMGRHLVATRDIKPGEIIIIEEGYALFPNIKIMYLLCSHCLILAWNGIPCDNCASVLYCSEGCKNKAWEEYHDIECSVLPYLEQKFGLDTSILKLALIIRIFIRAVKCEGLENVLKDACNSEDMSIQGLMSDGIFDSKKFKFCYNLFSNMKYVQENMTDAAAYCINLLFNLLIEHSTLLDKYKRIKNDGSLTVINSVEVAVIKTILLKLLAIVNMNTYLFETANPCDCENSELCNDTCTEKKGIILASCSSLTNHSCCPNISRQFMSGRKMLIFTVCPVKKGEMLSDSYGPTFCGESKIERQQFLQETKQFTCQCQACTENWSLIPNEMALFGCGNIDYKSFHNNINFRDWPHNEETMKDVVLGIELLFQDFDRHTAYMLSLQYFTYMQEAFQRCCGDNNQVPDKC